MIKEEKFEPLARYFRFRQALSEIDNTKHITIADLGCGSIANFYRFGIKHNLKIKNYTGIDPLLSKNLSLVNEKKVKLLPIPILIQIPMKKESVDYVVAFAFLEHIDNPEQIIKESVRILKKGGKAIYTLPTSRAKLILNFLSSNLSLISSREIEEHKNYFNKKDLLNIVRKNCKNVKIKHKYFEFGLNNLLILEKI